MHCWETASPTQLLALRASGAWFVVALHEVYHPHPVSAIRVQHQHASAQHSARIHVPYAAILYGKCNGNTCKRKDFDRLRRFIIEG